MAGNHYVQDKIVHPGFKDLLVKPKTKVEIDWTHPCAKWLTFAWVGDENYDSTNLVTGEKPTLTGSRMASRIERHSQMVDFDGTARLLDYVNSGQIINSSRSFLIMLEVQLDSFSPYGYPTPLMLENDDTNGYSIGLGSTAGYSDVYFGANGSTWYRGTFDVAAGITGLNRLALLYNGQDGATAGNFSAYANGTRETISAASGFVSITNSTLVGGNPSSPQYLNGAVGWAYVYKGIPEGAARWMVKNPHSVLKPVDEMQFYLPVAVGGGLSIPVAAYHYNHNLKR